MKIYIDCMLLGCVVCLFGFIDVYVYMCEFGVIYKEDFLFGIVVVLVGGVIMVLVMLNINFVIVNEIFFNLVRKVSFVGDMLFFLFS